MAPRNLLLSVCLLTVLPGLCLGERPPVERKTFRQPRLIEIPNLDPSIRLDIRYATENNFVRKAVYPEARAFLQAPAARALVRAHRALRKHGYGLVLFDAYRPWSVTKLFWDMTPKSKRIFVANPAKGSKHNRGCAVDVSLYDLVTGQEHDLGTPYDETTERAYVTWEKCPPISKGRRELLREIMENEGFFVNPWEWWHFDYKDWTSYAILDIPFSKLHRAQPLPPSPAPPPK